MQDTGIYEGVGIDDVGRLTCTRRDGDWMDASAVSGQLGVKLASQKSRVVMTRLENRISGFAYAKATRANSSAAEVKGLPASEPKRWIRAHMVKPAKINPMKNRIVQNTLSQRRCMK